MGPSLESTNRTEHSLSFPNFLSSKIFIHAVWRQSSRRKNCDPFLIYDSLQSVSRSYFLLYYLFVLHFWSPMHLCFLVCLISFQIFIARWNQLWFLLFVLWSSILDANDSVWYFLHFFPLKFDCTFVLVLSDIILF